MHSALRIRSKAPSTWPRHQLFNNTPSSSTPHPNSRVLRAMATQQHQQPSTAATTQMLAAFKSASDQAAFEKVFQLAQGAADVRLQWPGQPSTPGCSSSSSLEGNGAASAAHRWLDTAAVFKHLTTQRAGHVLLSTPSIPSTQEFMRQHTSMLPDGTVLAADQQTKGKGRGGNVWTSPPGCLMFTALRQLQVPGTQAAFINYVVCLAVVQGIKDATQHLLPGGLEVQIKWPNDLYHQGVKIGGALIHTTWAASSQQFCVLTGIGLNVSNSQPTTCLDDIIQQRVQEQQQQLQPWRVCKEQLLACVLNNLEACFDTFASQGFEPLKQRYLASWMHSNQVVELQDSLEEAGAAGAGSHAAARVPLTIVGLSPHGFLLATDPLGQEYELTPDGNSLDMMQGLIKKKL